MLALTIPAAVITYHLVENPVRHSTRLRSSAARSLIVDGLLIVAALAGAWMFQRFRSGSFSTDRPVRATGGQLAGGGHPTDFVLWNLVPDWRVRASTTT